MRISYRTRILSAAVALAVLTLPLDGGAATTAAAPEKNPLTVLIEQGQYWQAHRRGDLARQAWQKVLRIDPKQPDALFGMGIALADQQDTSGAQNYLARLKQVAPDYPGIDELAARVGQTSARGQEIGRARQLAQAGQAASAVQAYQQALAGRSGSPELQMEYYQTLGATPQGWEQARQGLAELARAHPENARIQLAYATHLTYREADRREGIARLARLAQDTSVGGAARASWRQALLWLGARASDDSLYRAYFAVVPNDPAVKARADALVSQEKNAQQNAQRTAAGRMLAEGFAALDQNDYETARARFASALSRAPNDADALGGMGVLLLKQEKFAQARDYLQRAVAAGGGRRWSDALKSATYWTDTSAAIGARSNGDFAQAKKLFERAIKTDPSDVTAQTSLGDMLLANGDAAGAEAAYRMALRRQSDNPDAIRGLVGALAAQGRGNEALAFANQLTEQESEKVGGVSALRGQAQAAEARAALARGDLGTARTLFEDALLNLPDDPWLRLDLARLYARQGALANARSLMSGLLAQHPDMPNALYASALLAEQMRDWSDGLAQLNRIAEDQRTAPMTALAQRLWVYQQIDKATALVNRGDQAQGHAVLLAAQSRAGNDRAVISALASAYASTGDTNRALTLMRGVLSATPNDIDAQLEYAGLLLNTRQEAELAVVMQRISKLSLSAQQRIAFDKINMATVISRADAMRQTGNLAGAYDVIAPWLTAYPSNADLLASLGRLYSASGDTSNALACYRIALTQQPNNVDLLTAAIGEAASAQDFASAQTMADTVLRLAPDDPTALAAIGRMYRAQGKNSLAAEYLRRSLLVQRAPAEQGVPPGWSIPGRRQGPIPLPGMNPFAAQAAAQAHPSFPGQSMPAYLPPMPPPAMIAPASLAPVNLEASPAYVPADTPWPTLPQTQPYLPETRAVKRSKLMRVSTKLKHTERAVTRKGSLPANSYIQVQYGQQPYASSPLPQPYMQQAYVQQQAYAQQPYAQQAYAQQPYAQQPYAQQAYAQQPYAQQPYAQQVYAQQPYAQQAYAQQAYAQQPYAQQPYAQQPYAQQPYAQQPYAQQPYAQQPYAQQPYAQQPYAQQPYAQQPYAQQPYAQQPYAQQPYAPMPITSSASSQGAVNMAYGQSEPGLPGPSKPLSVEEELAQINREQTSTIAGGPLFRNRQGEAGLADLTDIEMPLENRIQAGDGQVVVRVTPVTLDAGTPNNDVNTLARFGVGAITQTPTSPGSQTASGVGFSLGYEDRRVKADIGSSPIGFHHINLIGGIQYRNTLTEQTSFSLSASRRPVTDSLLSYAGTAVTGADGQRYSWGSVVSNAVRGDLAWDNGISGIYLNGQFQYLNGNNVQSNTGGKGGGGVYTRFIKQADQTFTVGVNTTVMSYAKNLSYFTYGQGGYFSPQVYVLLNLPVEFSGRNGLFSYNLKGSLGVQHFRQSSSPYFPTDLSLQNAAVQAGITPDANAVYPSSSKTGMAYSLAAAGEYQLAPQLSVGAAASFGNSYDYREWLAAVYIRYAFTKQGGVPTFPPTPLTSPYLPLVN